MRESLLAGHRGKWVAVDDGQIVAEGENVFDVLERVKVLGGRPYVGCVGEEDRPFVVRAAFSYDQGYRPFALPRVVADFGAERGGPAATFDDVIPDTGGAAVTALVYRGSVQVAGHVCDSLIQLVETRERIRGRDVLNQLRVTFDGPAARVDVENRDHR
jgi:hypothetical protein